MYYYVKRPQSVTTGMVKGFELLGHWCTVYEEIADHFTEGEEGREAKYHWKGFCYRSIRIPDNGRFRRIARKYRKVLWKKHCFSDAFLLSVIVVLSRFKWGREAFLRRANRKRLENIT